MSFTSTACSSVNRASYGQGFYPRRQPKRTTANRCPTISLNLAQPAMPEIKAPMRGNVPKDRRGIIRNISAIRFLKTRQSPSRPTGPCRRPNWQPQRLSAQNQSERWLYEFQAFVEVLDMQKTRHQQANLGMILQITEIDVVYRFDLIGFIAQEHAGHGGLLRASGRS